MFEISAHMQKNEKSLCFAITFQQVKLKYNTSWLEKRQMLQARFKKSHYVYKARVIKLLEYIKIQLCEKFTTEKTFCYFHRYERQKYLRENATVYRKHKCIYHKK